MQFTKLALIAAFATVCQAETTLLYSCNNGGSFSVVDGELQATSTGCDSETKLTFDSPSITSVSSTAFSQITTLDILTIKNTKIESLQLDTNSFKSRWEC
eukprot:Awhi_evm1s9658